MSNHGYFQAAGQAFGPCTPTQLQRLAAEGTIKPSTLIRRGEHGEWVEAGKVKGMFPTETTGTPKPQTLVAAETVIPKVEPQPLTVHQAAVNAAPTPFSLIKAALLLPFIPIGFWGQASRWRLYREEGIYTEERNRQTKMKRLCAARTSPAVHPLEPSLIEYWQPPARSEQKHYSVSVTIPTKDGDKTRGGIIMPNWRIPGPRMVTEYCFYPGLYTHYIWMHNYVRHDFSDDPFLIELYSGMTITEIEKAVPWISKRAMRAANNDIRHYLNLTDDGRDYGNLNSKITGEPKSPLLHQSDGYLKEERVRSISQFQEIGFQRKRVGC